MVTSFILSLLCIRNFVYKIYYSYMTLTKETAILKIRKQSYKGGSHFKDKETEAHRGKINCLFSSRFQTDSKDSKPGSQGLSPKHGVPLLL